MTETEYKEPAIKKSRVRISLIVIGSLIIVGGLVAYYQFSHLELSEGYAILAWGGSILLIYLGSLILIWSIINPYRTRIHDGLYFFFVAIASFTNSIP